MATSRLVPDLASLYQQATTAAGGRLALEESQRAIQRRQAVEEAIRSSYQAPTEGTPGYFESPTGRQMPAVPGTPGGINEQALLERLSQEAPAEALTLQQQLRTGTKSRVESGLMMARYAGQLARNVSDQQSWTAYKSRLQQIGFPQETLAALPEAFDPAAVKELIETGEQVTAADIEKELAKYEAKSSTEIAKEKIKGELRVDLEKLKGDIRANLEKEKGERKAAEAAEKFTASDANSLRAAAAGLFGGTFDPGTGRITGLEKGSEARALAITERAGTLFTRARSDGKPITHDQAVAEAARESGITVPVVNRPAPAPQGGGTTSPQYRWVPGQGIVPVAPGA